MKWYHFLRIYVSGKIKRPSSLFIGLLFTDVLELVPKENVSDVADRLYIEPFTEFLWIIFSMTSIDLSCIRAIKENTLCTCSFNRLFLEVLYLCRSLYLHKWAWSIAALKLLIWISLIISTWAISLVTFIPWNVILHQRQFHWLFSNFSMQSS